MCMQDALGLSPTSFIADAGWHMSYFMTPEVRCIYIYIYTVHIYDYYIYHRYVIYIHK